LRTLLFCLLTDMRPSDTVHRGQSRMTYLRIVILEMLVAYHDPGLRVLPRQGEVLEEASAINDAARREVRRSELIGP